MARMVAEMGYPAPSIALNHTSSGTSSILFQRAPAVRQSGSTPRRRFASTSSSTFPDPDAVHPPSKCSPPRGSMNTARPAPRHTTRHPPSWRSL